jgi:hypothetical protein
VVVHQAEGVAEPVKAFDHFGESIEKIFAVFIGEVDVFSGVASGGDVIDSARIFYS